MHMTKTAATFSSSVLKEVYEKAISALSTRGSSNEEVTTRIAINAAPTLYGQNPAAFAEFVGLGVLIQLQLNDASSTDERAFYLKERLAWLNNLLKLETLVLENNEMRMNQEKEERLQKELMSGPRRW